MKDCCETAVFVLAGAAVTVACSVFKLMDASSSTRLFSIHVNLNGEIRQKE